MKRKNRHKTTQFIDKSSLSLIISAVALIFSGLAYYGPQQHAMQRVSSHVDAVKFFRVGIFATCDAEDFDPELCETALDLAVVGAEEAMEALEAERSNLSGADYNEVFEAVYGTYTEAKERKFKLENPGAPYPDVNLSRQDIERIRAINEERR